MVSDAQREEIAGVPAEILHRIMRLPDPTFEAVNEALPDEYQYLAQAVLDLLTEPAEEEISEQEPVPAAPTPELQSEPQPEPQPGVTEYEEDEPVEEPTPAAPAPAPAPTSGAAAFLAQLNDSTSTVDDEPQGFDPADLLPIELVHRFAQYEWGATEDATSKVRSKVVAATDEKPAHVELNWDPCTDANDVLYRVVSTTMIGRPATPEENDQLALTVGNFYEDPIRPGEAYREYQVWAYPAQSADACFRAQPVLVGRELVIFPIRDLSVSASDGIISGTWESLPGHHHVRVFVSDLKIGGAPDSAQYELGSGVSERDFRHNPQVQGVTMRVVVKPVILLGDGVSTMTGPISETRMVDIMGDLTQTNFESVERVETNEGTLVQFSIYGPPAGSFRVYFTQRKPSDDLSWSVQPMEALKQEGLDGPDVASQDYGEISHNEQFDADYLWPDGWDAVFVTPVTVLGEYAWVGTTHALQRVQEVTEPELREYVGFQLATFGWPRGASMVKVERQYQGGGDRTTVKDFSEEDYTKHGGIRLQLDSGGEEVVLTPQNSYAGKTTYGPETVLEYPGLRRYLYDVQVQPNGQGSPGGLAIAVWCDRHDDLNPPQFSVLFNDRRLPLAAEDLHHGGEKLRAVEGEPAEDPATGFILQTSRISGNVGEAARWFIPASEFSVPGYLRLFMLPNDAVANGGVRKIITDERLNKRFITAQDIEAMRQPIPPPAPVENHNQEPTGRRGFFRRR